MSRCACTDARCQARPEAKAGNSPGYPGHPHYQCNQPADPDTVFYVKGENDPLPIPVIGRYCAACAEWSAEQQRVYGWMDNRCQCADRDCSQCKSRRVWPTGSCIKPATRIVRIQGPTPSTHMKEHAADYAYSRALCAACAAYHEAKAHA